MAKRQRFQWEDEPKQEAPLKPSRSAKKRAATALQDLAKTLLDLDAQTLNALELPPELLEALAEAKTFKSHEAKRRQMQFLGRLMRDLNPDKIYAIQLYTGQATKTTLPKD